MGKRGFTCIAPDTPGFRAIRSAGECGTPTLTIFADAPGRFHPRIGDSALPRLRLSFGRKLSALRRLNAIRKLFTRLAIGGYAVLGRRRKSALFDASYLPPFRPDLLWRAYDMVVAPHPRNRAGFFPWFRRARRKRGFRSRIADVETRFSTFIMEMPRFRAIITGPAMGAVLSAPRDIPAGGARGPLPA